MAYQVELRLKNMLSMLRFVVPCKGEWPNPNNPFKYGAGAKKVDPRLKDLQAIEARLGDGDVAMANA